LPGSVVRIAKRCVRDGHALDDLRAERPVGARRSAHVQLSVPTSLNCKPELLQPDAVDPNFSMQQRQQLEPKFDFLYGGHLIATFASVHVRERNVEAGAEADCKPAADADFHVQRFRGEGFDPRLGVHRKKDSRYPRTRTPSVARPPTANRKSFDALDIRRHFFRGPLSRRRELERRMQIHG
jgi:hypothetical protein